MDPTTISPRYERYEEEREQREEEKERDAINSVLERGVSIYEDGEEERGGGGGGCAHLEAVEAAW